MASKVGAPPTITRQDFAEIKSAAKLHDLKVIKEIALRLLAHFERPFELEADADTQPFRPVLPDAVHGHPLERGKGSPSEDIRASSFSQYLHGLCIAIREGGKPHQLQMLYDLCARGRAPPREAATRPPLLLSRPSRRGEGTRSLSGCLSSPPTARVSRLARRPLRSYASERTGEGISWDEVAHVVTWHIAPVEGKFARDFAHLDEPHPATRVALVELEAAFRARDAAQAGVLPYDQFFAIMLECAEHSDRLAPDLERIAFDVEEADRREREEFAKPQRKARKGWDSLYDC